MLTGGGSHGDSAFDKGIAVPGFRVQLVHRITDQAGWLLALIEKQQRRVNHLFVGKAAHAQTIGVL